MIFEIFSTKNSAKKLAFLKIAKNWLFWKSQKIVIITSTPVRKYFSRDDARKAFIYRYLSRKWILKCQLSSFICFLTIYANQFILWAATVCKTTPTYLCNHLMNTLYIFNCIYEKLIPFNSIRFKWQLVVPLQSSWSTSPNAHGVGAASWFPCTDFSWKSVSQNINKPSWTATVLVFELIFIYFFLSDKPKRKIGRLQHSTSSPWTIFDASWTRCPLAAGTVELNLSKEEVARGPIFYSLLVHWAKGEHNHQGASRLWGLKIINTKPRSQLIYIYY
jgi:hypothetical protein